MNAPKALQQYKQVDIHSTVQTASPHKLISMLLTGALEAFAKAKGAIERNEIDARAAHLNKGNDILIALRDNLNLEEGGEVASNLDKLYVYMLETSLQANRLNDAEKAQEIMNLLLEIKQGWDEMPIEYRNG
ncbi:flagellar export chaperone FliS [Nitrincola alkalisediminis]|uniref:flagellar export chaperone FliS n=1 Tax=Nitrincola alkalisediminis TaxID=1366656 RepID=UPI00187520B4|nr:flagellar export chaperone FliS [Nitrincola alkalisediminis]